MNYTTALVTDNKQFLRKMVEKKKQHLQGHNSFIWALNSKPITRVKRCIIIHPICQSTKRVTHYSLPELQKSITCTQKPRFSITQAATRFHKPKNPSTFFIQRTAQTQILKQEKKRHKARNYTKILQPGEFPVLFHSCCKKSVFLARILKVNIQRKQSWKV